MAANAVVFVFEPHQRAAGILPAGSRVASLGGSGFCRRDSGSTFDRPLPNLCCRFRRRRQHELHRSKGNEARLRQAPLLCQPRRFANVAQQQIGPLYVVERRVERLCQRFFHEALLQSDAQVAGENFDEKFCFRRRASVQRANEQWQLGRRPACVVQALEEAVDGFNGQSRRGCRNV